LLLSVVLAALHSDKKQSVLEPDDKHHMTPVSPRLQSITRAPTKPPTSSGAYGTSPQSSATNPPVVGVIGDSLEMDSDGNCYRIDTVFKIPAYAAIITPTPTSPMPARYPNQSTVVIGCNVGYQLIGNNQVTCLNSIWQGLPFGQCGCSRPSGWCGVPRVDVYYNVDCDGDGINDHACETYNSPPNSPAGGVGHTIITSTSGCQSNAGVLLQSCAVAFMKTSIPIIQLQCMGLSYTPASNMSECSHQCVNNPNCQIWQWSQDNSNECWSGNSNNCVYVNSRWTGAAKACVRPTNWCTSPGIGDQYYNVDCDNDGLLDHACANYNSNSLVGSGGRIASKSNCIDNWPSANNDDCPAAFNN